MRLWSLHPKYLDSKDLQHFGEKDFLQGLYLKEKQEDTKTTSTHKV